MPLANLPTFVTEVAFTTAPLATPTWVDISAYVRHIEGISITRGRPNESSTFAAGQVSLLLNNNDRRFDPLHGPAGVTLTGALSTYASTPDTAATSPTTDLEVVWIGSVADWTPANLTSLCGKWNPGGNQRAWQLRLTTGGILRLVTSATGTSTLVTTDCTAAVPFTSGAYAIKVTLDADNGAGSNVVKFWYAAAESTGNEEPASWTQLGSTVTTGGTRAIFDGTSTLDVGTVDTTATTYPFIGTCYRLIERHAIGGAVHADFNGRDITDSTATTCTSSATTEVWTRQGAATFTAAPYYGYLLPRRAIRIRATWSATTYDLFTGFTTGWPQTYGKGNMIVTVPLEAVDGLAWLAETRLPDVIEDYAQYSGIGDCAVFLRQNDGTNWVDVMGGPSAFAFSPAPNGASLCAGSDSPSVVFESATAWVWATGVAGYTMAFWIQTETVGSSSSVWSQVFGFNSGAYYGSRIGIDSGGRICAEATDYNPGTFTACRSSIPINDGQPHFVMFVNNAGTGVCYVDGVDVTVWDATGSGGDKWPCMVIGAPSGAYLTTSTPEFVGSLQDIVGFDTDATAVQAAALYQLFLGHIDESTSTRAGRVLTAVDWPYNDLAATPYGTCHAPWREGDSALSHLQAVAATEQGRLFVNVGGEVALQPRYWHQTDTRGMTSQATFSDDGAGISYQFLGTQFDDLLVQNDITVSAEGVGSANSQDATSITNYGWQSASISTLLPSIALCQDMADGLVYWRKDAQTRTLPLRVHPGAQTSAWATVLALEIGDRITVEITPRSTGSQIALSLLVESLTWDIDAEDWVLTIQASPVPPSFATYGSAVYGTERYGF